MMTDDAKAILSVWNLIKVGGTWGAPGPPSWIVNKTAIDAGTLMMGALGARTSSAFAAAEITIMILKAEGE